MESEPALENMEGLTGKNILVTGGAGFIGGHVVELLLQKKYRVIVVDIQKPCKSYFFLNHLHRKVEYRIADITKRSQMKSLFASVRPSHVIHLAALPIVREAYDDPYAVFETNIMGTVNVLESCRKTPGIKGIIVASSDKAYGKTNRPYSEHSPLKGDHPYDVSKSCGDLIAQTYAKTYGLPVVITRFGNVYGEGDVHFDRIVPGICKSLVANTVLDIRSDGTFVRDYIYVKDVANAYIFLLENMQTIAGEAFNVASQTTCSVLELIKKVKRALRKSISYNIQNTAINEIPYQHLNDTKIRKLGWKTRYPFGKSIRKTYRWYQSFLSP
jgi:CDP-glucose 4,6-dehydratase